MLTFLLDWWAVIALVILALGFLRVITADVRVPHTYTPKGEKSSSTRPKSDEWQMVDRAVPSSSNKAPSFQLGVGPSYPKKD